MPGGRLLSRRWLAEIVSPNDHHDGYGYFLRTVPLVPDDPLIRAINERHLLTIGTAAPDETVRHILWRLFFERDRFPTLKEATADWRGSLPASDTLAPITMGQWHGNFLYPSHRYFGPAVCGRPIAEQESYFQEEASRGFTHVLLNAEQDDWGRRRGHPEWTAGGFSAYATDGMDRLVTSLEAARHAGLVPLVGIVDQPTLRHLDLSEIIERSQHLVNRTAPHVCLYMLSWELNEPWGSADQRNPNIRRWIREVDWHGRDVGIHYAPPPLGNQDWEGEEDHVHGGYGLYADMPPNVVRLAQFPNKIDDETLRLRCRLGVEVNAGTGTKYCAFEHSGWWRRTPQWSEEDCQHRASICQEVMEELLPSDRRGSMNG